MEGVISPRIDTCKVYGSLFQPAVVVLVKMSHPTNDRCHFFKVNLFSVFERCLLE